jgi:hypothetical protein
MEFFLPSLIVLILAAVFVFFVIPRFAPVVLAIIAFLALILGAVNHVQMFKMDYRMMTWQQGASAAAPYVLIGFIVLYIIGFLVGMYQDKTPSVAQSIATNAGSTLQRSLIPYNLTKSAERNVSSAVSRLSRNMTAPRSQESLIF